MCLQATKTSHVQFYWVYCKLQTEGVFILSASMGHLSFLAGMCLALAGHTVSGGQRPVGVDLIASLRSDSDVMNKGVMDSIGRGDNGSDQAPARQEGQV